MSIPTVRNVIHNTITLKGKSHNKQNKAKPTKHKTPNAKYQSLNKQHKSINREITNSSVTKQDTTI